MGTGLAGWGEDDLHPRAGLSSLVFYSPLFYHI